MPLHALAPTPLAGPNMRLAGQLHVEKSSTLDALDLALPVPARHTPGNTDYRGDTLRLEAPAARRLMAPAATVYTLDNATKREAELLTQQHVALPSVKAAVPRYNAAVASLPHGDVLATGGIPWVDRDSVGGATGGEPVADTWVYKPISRQWQVMPFMHHARSWHQATPLQDGRVLVTGGAFGATSLAACETYDPATNAWSEVAPMHAGRAQHAAVLLADGNVLVAGGLVAGESNRSCEIYEVARNTWRPVGAMQEARRFVPATRLRSGKVLIAGGGNFKASAEVFDPSPEMQVWNSGGDMLGARYGHSATLQEDGSVLVVGGYGPQLQAATELYDPTDNRWTFAGTLTEARYFHTASALLGKTLILGGVDHAGAPLQTAEVYDERSKRWDTIPNLGGHRFHRAACLQGARLLVFGPSVSA